MALEPRSQEKDIDSPLVSVLILNYNGIKFLTDCFNSLQQTSYPSFEIVLVDNRSTDDSVSFTRSAYPGVRIVENDSNCGYSRGYNLSFPHARGKYLVLLNNDVKVDPGWLDPLVAAAEADPAVGALQPKLLWMLDTRLFEYAGASGGYMDIYGFPFTRGRLFDTIEEDCGQYEDPVRVFWTSGAAMFVRKSALAESDDLDEDFVHHMEEIDLCWRLQLAGYRLKAIPQSVVYHFAGGTIKPDSFMKMYWNHRNSIFMLIKNMARKTLVKVLLIRYILDCFALLFSLLKLDFKRVVAILKAHFWLTLHWPLMLRKRKAIQGRRRVPDRVIREVLYSESVVIKYYLNGKKTFDQLGMRVVE